MEQKSILITGCSSGIGLYAATALKARGYRVFAAARKPDDVATLQANGFESVQLDVNDSASIRQGLDKVLALTGGTLDYLFNNAGYLQAGAIEDLTRDMQRAQFETNVFGPMELIRLVVPVMRKQGHGRIIQNSSILGIITLPYYGAYNASKFALEGFTHSLRQELRDTNIQVSIINPGPISSHLRDTAYQHYQSTVKPNASATHEQTYRKLEETYFKPSKQDQKMTVGPEAVLKPLIHALESARPKIHYYVGSMAPVLACLKRLLPDRTLDWLLSKAR